MNQQTQNKDFHKVGTIPLHGNFVNRKQKKSVFNSIFITVIALEIPSHMYVPPYNQSSNTFAYCFLLLMSCIRLHTLHVQQCKLNIRKDYCGILIA